jgi:hypothetical protein
MGPIIYTTYGIAMGQRPETLSNSGGLRPTGTEPMSERPVRLNIPSTELLVRSAHVHKRFSSRWAVRAFLIRRSSWLQLGETQ